MKRSKALLPLCGGEMAALVAALCRHKQIKESWQLMAGIYIPSAEKVPALLFNLCLGVAIYLTFNNRIHLKKVAII